MADDDEYDPVDTGPAYTTAATGPKRPPRHGDSISTREHDLEQVLRIAKRCRDAQRVYFETRSKPDLIRAKSLESQLDAELARVL